MLRITSVNTASGPHQQQDLLVAGADVKKSDAVMIMIHGRGASADSILQLSQNFEKKENITFLAPQASGFSWYPYSFLAPVEQNQPGLDSGLQAIFDAINFAQDNGFKKDQIFLLGFSQGACLVSEYAARHPAKYAGIFILSGGLIGDKIQPEKYTGSLEGTPVFMGCSDIDPHIPPSRFEESANVFDALGATLVKKIYAGMGHLINTDEITHINTIIANG